jgi:hypothetical protein
MIDKVTAPSHKASKSLDELNARIKKTGSIGIKFTGTGPVPEVIKRLNANALKTFAKGKVFDPVLKSATSGFVNLAKYSTIAVGAAGTALSVFAVKSAVHMGMFAESTKLAFGLLTGNENIGEKVFGRTVELSTKLGLGVEDAAHSMQKLLAMQMDPASAEKWLKLGSDLKAVGVTDPALQRVMLDIAHVKATGKLNTRNVNMFANAGVSAQLLMEEIGKAMGTDEKGAVEAMHKGKVTSEIALPALERAIMRKTHEHSAGEAGEKRANTTLNGLMDKLKNAPALFGLKMASALSSGGAFDSLKKLVDSILGAIDSVDGSNISAFIQTALSGLTKLVPLGMEFAKGFGDGFGAMNEAMAGIDPSKASLETARDLGRAIAKGFEAAFAVIKKVADLVLWLDAHRDVAVGIAGMLAIDRVAGAGATARGIWAGGKGLLAGGQALAGGAGLVGAAKAAFGLGTAATTTAGTVATGAGTTGLAALTGGLGVAGAAAGGAALLGVGAAVAGYAYREEIANWMLGLIGNKDQVAQRGLGAPQPTSTLNGLQGVTAKATTNNVKFESSINIDGANHDPNEIARTVSDSQRGMMEQFFQSQALEQGATG